MKETIKITTFYKSLDNSHFLLQLSPPVPLRPLVLHPHHQQAQQGHRYEDHQAVVHPVKPLEDPGRLQAEHAQEEGGEQPSDLAPGERGERFRGWVVDLHQQLVEQGDDAPETEHAADGGDVDGGLAVRDDLEAEQGEPDGAGQAEGEEDTDGRLEVTRELVREARVEDVHDDSAANDDGPDIAGVFLDTEKERVALFSVTWVMCM